MKTSENAQYFKADMSAAAGEAFEEHVVRVWVYIELYFHGTRGRFIGRLYIDAGLNNS